MADNLLGLSSKRPSSRTVCTQVPLHGTIHTTLMQCGIYVAFSVACRRCLSMLSQREHMGQKKHQEFRVTVLMTLGCTYNMANVSAVAREQELPDKSRHF